jgi:hypothetical protein
MQARIAGLRGAEMTAKSHFNPYFGRLTIVGNSVKVTYPNQTGV